MAQRPISRAMSELAHSPGTPSSTHEDPRWTAVTTRDAAADGHFVFAVRTTGVYCRPSCPSRQPRRENVVFYRVPEAAEAAGYRACKRCRPKDARASDPALRKVRRACTRIDEALVEGESGPPALAALAKEVATSPHHLLRLFKKHLGITPHEYADARRLELVKRHLRSGEGVSGALYAAGYGSPSRLYERSDAQLGMTPATYRRDGMWPASCRAGRRSARRAATASRSPPHRGRPRPLRPIAGAASPARAGGRRRIRGA